MRFSPIAHQYVSLTSKRMRSELASLLTVLVTAFLLMGQGVADRETVKDTQFSTDRGFYWSPTTVLIQSKTEGARIRYTLDGSAPTPAYGLGNTNPVTVSVERTTTLRAMAYKEGMVSSNVDTHTYLFIEEVLKQPYNVPGFPQPVLRTGYQSDEKVTLDYEMDPSVVSDPRYRKAIRAGLLSIPTISIVLDRDDLFGSVETDDSELDMRRSGVYWGDTGRGSTRAASVELIYPEKPQSSTQVDAGLESHSWSAVKRALKLKFQSEYGAGKWDSRIFRDGPLNRKSAAKTFDRIVLRSGKDRSWATRWHPERTTYVRDQWARDTQIAMSGIGAHGTFVHLYLNGLYWGMYNVTERPDSWFQATYFGGAMDDFFSVKHNGPFQGDSSRWDYLRGPLRVKNAMKRSRYRQLREYIDVEQFADYLILCWYSGTRDWPQNNWYAGNRNTPPSPARFFIWDAEEIWASREGAPVASVHPRFRARATEEIDTDDMVGIWHSLRRNSDFMTLFADRVYTHCFDDGPLTDANAIARWHTLTDFVADAVVAESARWGDVRAPFGDPTRTRDGTFVPEVERVVAQMTGNVSQFIDALRKEGYYPAIDPPEFSALTVGSIVNVLNPNARGALYFTLDGRDPRASGGEVASGAFTGSGDREEVIVRGGVIVKARVRTSKAWSALATWP